MYNWETKRKQLSLVKALYAAQGRTPVIVDSALRLESSMAAGQQQFTFNIGTSQSQNNTERRLDLNDGFSIFEVGIFICKPAAATSTIFKLYTYPNASIFSTSNVATSLDGMYNNGVLNFSKDQVNYIENYPVLNHRFVPLNQDALTGASGYTTSGATAIASTALDSFDGKNAAWAPLASFINITGRDSLNISINLPVGLVAVETVQRVVLCFRGYKAFNVAR